MKERTVSSSVRTGSIRKSSIRTGSLRTDVVLAVLLVVAGLACAPDSQTGEGAPEQVSVDEQVSGSSAPPVEIPPRDSRLDDSDPAETIAEGSPSVSDTETSVSLKAADRSALDELIKQQRGKLVLVDFWATWCVPCVKGLPHTVELASKYDSDQLVVVTLAMETEEQRAAVHQTLTSVSATSTRNLIANQDAFQAMDTFEISSGTLPTLRLYDREGVLVRTFGDGDPNPIDFQEIEVAVREQLAKETAN